MRKIMRHRIGLAVVVWLLAIGWTTSSWALTAVPRTFAELVGLADWVLIGTVTQVTSAVEAQGTRIYTYVTLADLEVIKGEWHDTEYVLRVSGGVVDQRGEVYPGFPQFEAGKRYILFIQGNFSALFPVVGLHQGMFRVEWDPARQQTVVWPLSDQTPAQTFAFDSAIESSVVLPNQTTGSPVVWAFPQVTMSVHLGSVSPGTTLANGTTNWDANAAESLALWNTVVPNFFTMDTTEADPCERRNGVNTVTFAHDHCGNSFGDAAAVTRKSYIQRSGHFFLVEADVVLNANLCWNAYAGPLHPCEAPLNHFPAIDIQRVMLHELGHVLGLEHPDAAGQTVVAVMNSYLSDVDTLMQDDRDGAVFLYSQPSLTAIVRASSGSGSGEGGGGGLYTAPGHGCRPHAGSCASAPGCLPDMEMHQTGSSMHARDFS